MKQISRKSFFIIMVFTIIMLSSCKKEEKEVKITSDILYIVGDGTVTRYFVDDFLKDYYNEDELRAEIESELAEFNKHVSKENAAVLNSLTVEDAVVTLVIDFEKAEYYAQYHNTYVERKGKLKAFSGTLQEAEAEGYKFEEGYLIAGETIKIHRKDFDDAEQLKVFIISDEMQIRVKGKVKYYSEGVQMNENTLTTSGKKENYIIFR